MRSIPRVPALALTASLALIGLALAPSGRSEAPPDAPAALAPPVFRPAPTADQARALARGLDAAKAGDWAGAKTLAAASGEAGAADMILWTRLRDGIGTWTEYSDFLIRAPDWPRPDQLRARAEPRMPADLPPAEVIAFFAGTAPQTGTGSLRLAEAFKASGDSAAAEAEIICGWTSLSLSGLEQGAIALDWNAVVTPFNAERLDMLLWRGLTAEAENMLPLVDADWQALGRTRIGVRRNVDGSTALIEALPARLLEDPGLGYERYLYRVRQGRWEEAAEYMVNYSASAESLGRPDFWMERRANLAREALQRGDVETAYALAAGGHGTGGADYADAEWMAGFIALTLMDDPATAAKHFRTFQTIVFTPISLGRAGYWLGLAEEGAGNAEAAREAFAFAAAQQTSFYGQLAAEHAGLPLDPTLAGEGPMPDWRAQPLMDSGLVRAGQMLARIGEDGRAMLLLRAAAAGQPAEGRAALSQMAIDLGLPHVGLRIAKDAAADGMVLPAQYYPLDAIARQDWPVPTELALAIARQESEMNPAAGSGAGARGLMQLMPATAREVADSLGLAYDSRGLTTDPIYNASLGTEYLARMLRRFDGSYILAAAAYNAGPGRVGQWIEALGDPRAPGIDPVTWIETIPYSETRNYVMRVLEGMQVYRLRLAGAPGPTRLASDIAIPTGG